jgi:hypothetical protein
VHSCSCLAGFQDTSEGKNASKCEDINECAKTPCLNNAKCTESTSDQQIPPTKFKCTCAAGFAGGWCPDAPPKHEKDCNKTVDAKCDIDIDECASKPCKNGAACVESLSNKKESDKRKYVAADDYRCVCGKGFTNGDCGYTFGKDEKSLEKVYAEKCTTMSSKSGGNCDQVVDPCAASAACANGARCISALSKKADRTMYDGTVIDVPQGQKRCLCNPGSDGGICNYKTTWRQGKTCKKTGQISQGTCKNDLNECASAPCQNSGSCIESSKSKSIPLDTFTCKCNAGFANGVCSYDNIPEYDAECAVVRNGVCDLLLTNASATLAPILVSAWTSAHVVGAACRTQLASLEVVAKEATKAVHAQRPTMLTLASAVLVLRTDCAPTNLQATTRSCALLPRAGIAMLMLTNVVVSRARTGASALILQIKPNLSRGTRGFIRITLAVDRLYGVLGSVKLNAHQMTVKIAAHTKNR